MNGHREVYLQHGEVEYFDDPHYEKRGRGYLDHLFDKAPAAQVYGFKRPELLARPECPPRIADELPGVRLLAVLREPIARTVSAYFHYVSLRAVPMLPLNEGLAQILNGRHQRQYPMAREIIDYSLYGAQLRRYREYFDAGNIQTIFDEDLCNATMDTLRRAFQFIGVSADNVDPPVARAVNVGISGAARLRFHRAISPLAYGYSPKFSGIRQNRLAVGAYKALVRFDKLVLGRVYQSERPSLDPAIRARLVELFRPDVDDLRNVCGPIPLRWNESLAVPVTDEPIDRSS